MTNPYVGSEPYQTAWQHGYDWGAQNPGSDQPTPPDMSGWGYDQQTTAYIGQVWQEGALAGRTAGGGGGGQSGGGQGGETSQLPHYDAGTDTLYVEAEQFPVLTSMAEAGDFDTWLQNIGVDPAIFADDPVA